MRNLLTCVALVTAAGGTPNAALPEYLWGTYESLERRLPLRFDLCELGVRNLEVLGESYRTKDVRFELIERFGNSKLMKLAFDDKGGSQSSLSLLLFVDSDRIQLVSGYFVRYKNSQSRESDIERVRAAEFAFEPCVGRAGVGSCCK